MPAENNLSFESIISDFQRLSLLSDYTVQIEITNGEKYLTATSLGLDGITSEINLTVSDIIYFTEYGTVTTPGYYMLERLLLYIEPYLDKVLDKIIDGICNDNWDKPQIELEFERFEVDINGLLPAYFAQYTDDIQFLAKTIGLQGNTAYLLDPQILQKYIKIKIFEK